LQGIWWEYGTQSIENGTLHPNFKPIKTSHSFGVERYTIAVSNKLRWALDGLVEESE
jgi:hypothetical protein